MIQNQEFNYSGKRTSTNIKISKYSIINDTKNKMFFLKITLEVILYRKLSLFAGQFLEFIRLSYKILWIVDTITFINILMLVKIPGKLSVLLSHFKKYTLHFCTIELWLNF